MCTYIIAEAFVCKSPTRELPSLEQRGLMDAVVFLRDSVFRLTEIARRTFRQHELTLLVYIRGI